MKIIIGVILLKVTFAFGYVAEIRDLHAKNKTVLFTLTADEKTEADKKSIHALFKQKDKVVVAQDAILDAKTGELIKSSIEQIQTKEKGTTEVVGDQVKLTYKADGKPMETKEFKKPKRFVTTDNFDDWLVFHFDELKKSKSVQVEFLAWDRLEIYKFKLTYLGLESFDQVKAQHFKLVIDNVLLAQFVPAIEIWKSEDMQKMLKFEGRVAVKRVKGPGLENFDGEVLYFH